MCKKYVYIAYMQSLYFRNVDSFCILNLQLTQLVYNHYTCTISLLLAYFKALLRARAMCSFIVFSWS